VPESWGQFTPEYACFPKFLDFAANPGATNQEFDEALFIFYFSIHIIDYPCIFTYMIIKSFLPAQ